MDAESVRENTIALLMNRVEMLESRLEEQQPLVGPPHYYTRTKHFEGDILTR